MKYTYFLRGLGLGLLLAAIILCVSYRTNSSAGESNVVEQAKKLGMIFPKGTQEPPVASEVPAPVVTEVVPTEAPPVNGASSGAGVTGDENVPQTEPVVQPTEQPAMQPTAEPPAASVADSTKKKPEKTEGKKFTVRGGLTSTTIAQQMKEAGLIDDVSAMDEYMEKNGYSRKIRTGEYIIPEGADYAEIARIITRQ